MALADYKIRIIARACATRFDNGEADDLKTILNVSYPNLAADDRQAIVDYVATIRPDIPYEIV